MKRILLGVPAVLILACVTSASADGGKITFVHGGYGHGEIYVMDADGGNQTRLTDDIKDDRNPVWSPDGRRIAFESERDGDLEIFVMDADGGKVTRLTDDESDDGFPAWSPAE